MHGVTLLWQAEAVHRVPDPERELGRTDNVRYVGGAPEEWSSWIRPGDTVSLVSLGRGIAVENPSGRRFLPQKAIQRIDLEDHESPRWRDGAVDSGKMTLALMNMGALQALPRRLLDTLTITSDDRVIEFDVSQRTWPDEALVTDEAFATLLGGDNWMVAIRDGSWRWIVVKQFRFPAGSSQSSTDAVNTLLSHPSYWDNYLGGGYITPHVHGPYRLENLSIDSFRHCDASTAMTTIEDWLHEDGHLSEEQIEGSLSDVYQLITEADTCLRLDDLDEDAYHDYGFVLDKPFIELVVVGPEDRVALIVASGD